MLSHNNMHWLLTIKETHTCLIGAVSVIRSKTNIHNLYYLFWEDLSANINMYEEVQYFDL